MWIAIGFLITAVLSLMCFFLYWSRNDTASSDASIWFTILFIMAAAISYECMPYKAQSIIRVDLPEDYMCMSHNKSKPDTLLGFYDNDTVYITFKPGTP